MNVAFFLIPKKDVKMKNTPALTFANTENIYLSEIQRHIQNRPVYINAHMEDLIARATEQNFVPVVDDNGVFIGIVRRSELIRYIAKNPLDLFYGECQ